MKTIIGQQVELNSENNPVFQTKPYASVSDKYQLIRTDKIVEVFADNGLHVVGQSNVRSRNQEKLGFQKHLVMFSKDSLNLGEEQLQLLLTNAHDGSTSYRLDFGVFRFVCANGLVSGDFESTVKIRHTGNCLDRLDKAIRYQLDRLPNIAAKINEFKSVELHPSQIRELTMLAAKIRCLSASDVRNVASKRSADQGLDLWRVFNRIQEASIKGGLLYFDSIADEGKGKWKRARGLTGVDSVLKVNKELWNAAETLVKAA